MRTSDPLRFLAFSATRRFLLTVLDNVLGVWTQIVYKNSILSLAKKLFLELLVAKPYALWASQVWSPHFHWDLTVPSLTEIPNGNK